MFIKTFQDIRAAHVAIEAPFQIIMTGTMMSLGVLKFLIIENLETDQLILKIAFGLEIILKFFPSIFSLIGILLELIVFETNKIVGYFAFIPTFLFRYVNDFRSSLHWAVLVLFCVLFVRWSMFLSVHL